MPAVFSYVAIPAVDFERAFAFYQVLTDGALARNTSAPFPMAYFRDASGAYVGHLFQLAGFRPSIDGPIVYLRPPRGIDDALELVRKAGGTVLFPKTVISATAGYWAMFGDTEGNRLAVHEAPR